MKRHRSEQNMVQNVAPLSGQNSDKSRSSENDTDEKVGSNAPVSQSINSLKKPEFVPAGVRQADMASTYTGKSFFNCPYDQEQTK